jgi:uncharacterized protein YbjQ (UPF0145 family)
MDLLVQLLVLVGLLTLGWVVGGIRERRHLRSLAEREEDYADILVTDLTSFPQVALQHHPPRLMVAEVVIAADYLKAFLASFRQFFGGELKSYRSLMERGRREAILRLVEQARVLGYNALANLRVESADVGGNAQRRGMPMVSVIAYATAYRAVPPPPRF